jgi:predicted hotdog family 3-hydroxylacyl-ACP dehydratase
MKESIVKGDDVLKYIPQRPPFIMIDEIVEASQGSVETRFCIPENHVMTEEGVFQEGGIIENMAQSAAAMTGMAAVLNNTPVKTGFIGAVKKLSIYNRPKAGQTICTKIAVTNEVFDFTIIKGEVFVENSLFAECEMNIFIQQ